MSTVTGDLYHADPWPQLLDTSRQPTFEGVEGGGRSGAAMNRAVSSVRAAVQRLATDRARQVRAQRLATKHVLVRSCSADRRACLPRGSCCRDAQLSQAERVWLHAVSSFVLSRAASHSEPDDVSLPGGRVENCSCCPCSKRLQPWDWVRRRAWVSVHRWSPAPLRLAWSPRSARRCWQRSRTARWAARRLPPWTSSLDFTPQPRCWPRGHAALGVLYCTAERGKIKACICILGD